MTKVNLAVCKEQPDRNAYGSETPFKGNNLFFFGHRNLVVPRRGKLRKFLLLDVCRIITSHTRLHLHLL